jgi:hypothetical protein
MEPRSRELLLLARSCRIGYFTDQVCIAFPGRLNNKKTLRVQAKNTTGSGYHRFADGAPLKFAGT